MIFLRKTDNWYGYGYLGTHRVWVQTLVPTNGYGFRYEVFFQIADMETGTILPCPNFINCHP